MVCTNFAIIKRKRRNCDGHCLLSRHEEMSNMSWKKQNIIDCVESKREIVTHPVVKIDLLKKVRKLKKNNVTNT